MNGKTTEKALHRLQGNQLHALIRPRKSVANLLLSVKTGRFSV